MPLERICALLDPGRKECSADHLVRGNSNLKSSVIEDVNSIARTFVKETIGPTSSAPKCGGDSDPGKRPSKKLKVLSDLEERRLVRLARSKTKLPARLRRWGL